MNRKLTAAIITLLPLSLSAQNNPPPDTGNPIFSPGIMGTLILIALVLSVAVIIMSAKLSSYLTRFKSAQIKKQQLAFREELIGLPEKEIDAILATRKAALQFRLSGTELGSDTIASDKKGLIQQITNSPGNPLFDEKKKSPLQLETPDSLKKIVTWYLGASVIWLVLGTLVGQYLGMKFVWPELDTVSW
ncbi:MAG TPA: cytochrome oxidase subunit I, partial [Chryseosolibacter sp.]|nr:cytochrome oxidase subunit I [Chryseosolibacter sp.]